MKIKKITIDNVRCFKHLEIDLNTDSGIKKWAFIIGDNGIGKTTILRSIAIGLSEQSGAAGLIDELEGDWIRWNETAATIKIDMEPFPGCEEKATITTSMKESIIIDEIIVEQKIIPKYPKTYNWNDLFICGYGAARRQYGSRTYSEYTVVDSVYTLFNYDHPLQNPELAVRRLTSEGFVERDIFMRLEKVLMLVEGAIELDKSGINVSGPWGKRMPMGALGDGYQATLAWLLDLYGWLLLYEDNVKNSDLRGIILLDEIEHHLHPKWQKKIIPLLTDQFPELQFIATSHSPLAVIGTTELNDEECSIVILEQKEDHVENRISTPPRGKRVDQILTSYMFDLLTASDNAIKRDIERYSQLYTKDHRTKSEEEEITTLYSSLDAKLGSGETDLELRVTKYLDTILDELYSGKLNKIKDKKSPETYEMLRQLKQLID